jgi:fused signal recognition particle receptor
MALNWFKKNRSKKKDEETIDEDVPSPPNAALPVDAEPVVDVPLSDVPPTSDKKDHLEDSPTISAVNEDASTDIGAIEKSNSILGRLRRGLSKTRKILTTDLDDLFAEKKRVDDAMLEDLEGILITADIGVQTTMDLMKIVSRKAAGIGDAAALKEVLKEEILSLLSPEEPPCPPIATKPKVIMVVGVNGVGKTTTIGKLAARYRADGQTVLIAAADTWRAAAVEQLAIWADRSGADIVKHKNGADPAAVAYDGVKAARARETDIVLVDTAGRLHTKTNLMEELKKIKRSVAKILPDAPHEVLLVLDATTGQNALSQARMFDEALKVTGIALAKLDGTAKGGIVVSIYDSFHIPLQYIGVGEKIDDLQDFRPRQFVNALF